MMEEIEYLYHYTSIESLALILKNKTIRLNPLDKMDDLQEQKTADVENLGKFVFVLTPPQVFESNYEEILFCGMVPVERIWKKF